MTLNYSAPKGSRFHIGVFGRRNVGKSTTFNALARQSLAIVSETPGTTTDPLEKALEILPLGPVLLVDTAGVDDCGTLGAARVEKTQVAYDRVDCAALVIDATRAENAYGEYEAEIVAQMRARKTPIFVVVNKVDLVDASTLDAILTRMKTLELRAVPFSADRALRAGLGAPEIREAILELAPDAVLTPPPILGDLIPRGGCVALVTPIDKEAPKGRLILPQVQSLRDALDADAICVVVKETQLENALRLMAKPPALVVTDSQAFRVVDQITPPEIPLTSFSILFARQKGDFPTMLRGAQKLDQLTSDSRVLIAEACAHHPIAEDIGTVKIPRALRARFGESLMIDHVQGRDFPSADELKRYDLIIHCGACMFNRREMTARLARAVSVDVPITNYGLALASLNGILSRAVAPLLAVDQSAAAPASR